MMKTASGGQPALKMVNPEAAAMDIGSTMHMAAVNPDSDEMPVKRQMYGRAKIDLLEARLIGAM